MVAPLFGMPSGTDGLAGLRRHYLADESRFLAALVEEARVSPVQQCQIQSIALALAEQVRQQQPKILDAMLQVYRLDHPEGVLLMRAAEALLRIPDKRTANTLLHGLIQAGQWHKHIDASRSWIVNAASGLLALAEKLLTITDTFDRTFSRPYLSPLLTSCLRHGTAIVVRHLAHEFVIGETIEVAQKNKDPTFRYSFDMLGEAALTAADAARYFSAYREAIFALRCAADSDPFADHSVSVKLSALHPRYEYLKRDRVLNELGPRLLQLCKDARGANINLTIDAEETDRLELSLELFAQALTSSSLEGWNGLGLAVQAYQKRAPYLIDWLASLAQQWKKTIPVRLVKGAYWDSEIKRAQIAGLARFPVYLRKSHTDIAYLACGRRLLSYAKAFYPQLATHNAHSIAYFLALTRGKEAVFPEAAFEFQRLYGMGEGLHKAQYHVHGVPIRIYAPVGSFKTLLPYLVRRLLENGANNSFVNQINDPALPLAEIVADPITECLKSQLSAPQHIALPPQLYGTERPNARGLNMADFDTLESLHLAIDQFKQHRWQAAPLIGGQRVSRETCSVYNPANREDLLGEVVTANRDDVELALKTAYAAAEKWNSTPVEQRAAILFRAADAFENNQAELIALLIREGGKTYQDALSELREAVDFCRFYANEAKRLMQTPVTLPGTVGEENTLILNGRGVFFCISPWNFPLAIFIGQITAALATGNAVIAKPGSQTALIAMRAVELLIDAGLPAPVCNLLPGSGGIIGKQILEDGRIDGIVFTGSTEVAQQLFRGLSRRNGAILPLIAETGGLNAMIVDSSALAEQVVPDVLASAFNSAGQRCSALRLLFLQEEISDEIIRLLKGAMAELKLGDPSQVETDIGPVIDEESQRTLAAYIHHLRSTAKEIAEARPPSAELLERGCFIAPIAFEISAQKLPEREVFGPILHIIRWKAGQLSEVLAAIHDTGYGLTLGIHSRVEAHIHWLKHHARVGNIYINRNQIGAIVGSQPFGGEGLSGTGFKAGGPHYLLRFIVERSISNNTVAVGGNATLLAMNSTTR